SLHGSTFCTVVGPERPESALLTSHGRARRSARAPRSDRTSRKVAFRGIRDTMSDARDAGQLEPREAAGHTLRPAEPVLHMTPEASVYVVDDDESVRRALARLIRSLGLHVETFASAQAFLEYQPPDRPACLVLDVRLPGSSGLELQASLGRAQRTLPIIFI